MGESVLMGGSAAEEPLGAFHRGLTNILTHCTLDQDVQRQESGPESRPDASMHSVRDVAASRRHPVPPHRKQPRTQPLPVGQACRTAVSSNSPGSPTSQ